jgi:hypothetical protein
MEAHRAKANNPNKKRPTIAYMEYAIYHEIWNIHGIWHIMKCNNNSIHGHDMNSFFLKNNPRTEETYFLRTLVCLA